MMSQQSPSPAIRVFLIDDHRSILWGLKRLIESGTPPMRVVGKEAPAETILTAIARVHEGQLWLDRAATGRIFVEFSRKDTAQPVDPEQQKIESLT